MIVCGIDYSMTSPAICVHTGTKWSFANCKFHYFPPTKKSTISDKFFKCYEPLDFLCNEQRFNNLAAWALTIIPLDAHIFIEGYSYASKGVVFNIGENGGVLKNKLWLRKPSVNVFTTFAPQSVKKFATGKGTADKIKMHEAFVKETGVKIDQHFMTNPGNSPISDLVDSYYIAKLGFYTLENKLLAKAP